MRQEEQWLKLTKQALKQSCEIVHDTEAVSFSWSRHTRAFGLVVSSDHPTDSVWLGYSSQLSWAGAQVE